MIELRHVSKRYGRVEAVRDLSFCAPKGQIVGLLGQNGAGKTTTLNMLTGYFPPSEGQVLVDGMDMLTEPRACKRCIGYLPEQPPLYDEMTVHDYLLFCSELKEVERRDRVRHVQEIMQLCGLTDMAERTLGRLSKGYRQRAGIAQALCGDPPVLVLDEPTVGLDPRQVVEIRSLIRELGKTHTIIFSSHLLAEVQQLCQRVIILHKGQAVHQCDISAEQDSLTLRAVIAGDRSVLLPALRKLPCVADVQCQPAAVNGCIDVLLTCRETDGEKPQAQLFRLLSGMNAPLYALYPQRDSLEEIFLRVTADDAAPDDAQP